MGVGDAKVDGIRWHEGGTHNTTNQHIQQRRQITTISVP